MEGQACRLRREQNANAWLAWHIEALARAKKLPKLKTLLSGERTQSRPQTWQEMKAIAMMWKSAISRGARDV